MEKSSFFNDIDNDRLYFAEDFARHLKKYFTNGIFNNELAVIANNDMSITIKAGDANIEGYRYTNTVDLKKDIEIADGVLKRIDNVVLRLDLTNRLISAQIIKGEYSDLPSAPALVRSTTVYDIKLAEITVNNGITSISQADIKDTRPDTNLCGIVTSTVKTLDVTDAYNQLYAKYNELIEEHNNNWNSWYEQLKSSIDTWFEEIKTKYSTSVSTMETNFNDWFNNIKEQFGDDPAGNLLNKINDVDKKVDNLKIPTKTSDLTNDSDYLTDFVEEDPTVPQHVKDITNEDITNWNGKANPSSIPKKLSELSNDIVIEASSEEQAKSLSASNPGKIYCTAETE